MGGGGKYGVNRIGEHHRCIVINGRMGTEISSLCLLSALL